MPRTLLSRSLQESLHLLVVVKICLCFLQRLKTQHGVIFSPSRHRMALIGPLLAATQPLGKLPRNGKRHSEDFSKTSTRKICPRKNHKKKHEKAQTLANVGTCHQVPREPPTGWVVGGWAASSRLGRLEAQNPLREDVNEQPTLRSSSLSLQTLSERSCWGSRLCEARCDHYADLWKLQGGTSKPT